MIDVTLGPDKIIGLTVHYRDEAIRAENNGADYVGLGPIFNTATKKTSENGLSLPE